MKQHAKQSSTHPSSLTTREISRREALVQSNIGSLRMEGLEPTQKSLEIMQLLIHEKITIEEAIKWGLERATRV